MQVFKIFSAPTKASSGSPAYSLVLHHTEFAIAISVLVARSVAE